MPGKNWMSTAKLRALFELGWTYDEIAEANERETSWRPDRSTVAVKREALGFPARYSRHTELLPWNVLPEHNDHRFRRMLQAESRRRQGGELSYEDRSFVGVLTNLLFGRGEIPLVVGYDQRIGWYLADRTDGDEDIIRRPST
jgi:hypothetical protein